MDGTTSMTAASMATVADVRLLARGAGNPFALFVKEPRCVKKSQGEYHKKLKLKLK